MLDNLFSRGIKADFFCDTNEKLWGSAYHGVECISLPELIQMEQRDFVVIIESIYYEEIKAQLTQAGISNILRVYFEKIEIEEYIADHGQEAEEKIKRIIKLCADERSKEIYRHIVSSWFMDEVPDSYFESIYSKEQYFDPELIQLKNDEAFVDAGAYVGDTAEQFLKACNGNFEKAHLFELDPDIYKKLCQTIERLDADNTGKFQCYPYGISDKNGQVAVACGDRNSAILAAESQDTEAHATALVRTLDEVLANERITFIKMDIEGAELGALKGAGTIIKNQRPILAICMYHSAFDMLNIPLYIKELVPEYQIYIRHYTNEMFETVCYAIPSERLE